MLPFETFVTHEVQRIYWSNSVAKLTKAFVSDADYYMSHGSIGRVTLFVEFIKSLCKAMAGKKVVTVDVAEPVATSGLVAARLKRGQLTKPAQLFVDFCRERLAQKAHDAP